MILLGFLFSGIVYLALLVSFIVTISIIYNRVDNLQSQVDELTKAQSHAAMMIDD